MQADKDTKIINYRIVRKRVKNINLHVSDDGEIWVSAPRSTPKSTIDAFVHSKADWIVRVQERIACRVSLSFFDGSSLLLHGERVPVLAAQGGKRKASMLDGALHLILPDEEDAEAAKQAVDEWLFAYSNGLLPVIGGTLFCAFARYGVAPPQLRARRMTARWGSCHPKTGVVLLSHRLVCTPPACVEYVVAHELAHLVHPNHSAAFYALVSEVIPDHKERRALLKQYAGVLK